jgi:hypothetical protein
MIFSLDLALITQRIKLYLRLKVIFIIVTRTIRIILSIYLDFQKAYDTANHEIAYRCGNYLITASEMSLTIGLAAI